MVILQRDDVKIGVITMTKSGDTLAKVEILRVVGRFDALARGDTRRYPAISVAFIPGRSR